MEYGAAYSRVSRQVDSDAVSVLSRTDSGQQQQPRYQAYRPVEGTDSVGDTTTNRAPSWLVSPVDLQQSLPPDSLSPEQPANPTTPSPQMRPSIFAGNGTLDSPYQEPVAWANSTQFGAPIQEAYKPQNVGTTFVVTDHGHSRENSNNSTLSRRYFRHPRRILEPWKTGFWIRFPWWGFGALFLILVLTGASAGILLATNGMSVEDWKFGRDNAQPYVYISVFEMVMNFLILFALTNGMTIRFWRLLLHGTTLSSIHDTYESVHLWPAVKRVLKLRLNAVAIACVLTALSFARGPLLQRALTLSENDTTDTRGTLDLKIAPYPIVQYFQSNGTNPRKQGGVTEAFSTVLRGLSAGAALLYPQPSNDCGDYCTGTVKGFSFKTECSSAPKAFELDAARNSPNPTVFSISYKQESDALTLATTHKDTSSCKGDLLVQTCKLTQVKSDYSFVIINGTINRSNEPDTQTYDEDMPLDTLLMKKYWPLAFETLYPTLSVNITPSSDFSRLTYNKCVAPGIARDATGNTNSSSASCSDVSADLTPGLLANDPSIIFATESTASSGEDPLCSLTWKDPMPSILDTMRSLAFRITVDMAITNDSTFSPSINGDALSKIRADWHQSVPVTGRRSTPVYHTSPILIAFGVLLSVIAIVAILPLYNGFWELGRQVSLNPLEIAKAFGAPLFDGIDGNATPEVVLIERGGMNVRYGALERYGDGKRLRVEECSRATVRVPWQGEIFG